MSTTRSQKRRNNQQEVVENVSEGFVSPVLVENSCPLDQDVVVAGPSKPKSPRVENSVLESLRVSLKEEITSEIKSLPMESQREMLKLLRSETEANVRNSTIDETEASTMKQGASILRRKQCESILQQIATLTRMQVVTY